MSQQSLAAEVLGITYPRSPLTAYFEGFQTLFGTDYDPLSAPVELAKNSAGTQLEMEVTTDVKVLHQIAQGEEIKTANTLTDWPSYADMMQQHGTRATWAASALMIGSLTPMSSRSFVCAADTLYGAERAYIVDPEATPQKAQHGTFVYGDGLHLPFKNDSIDYVHTNRLLHMLNGASPTEPLNEDNALRLFSEISRVMPPGGQLLMVERAPQTNSALPWPNRRARNRLSEFVAAALPDFGFAYVHVAVKHHYKDRKFLHDPERRFKRYRQEKSLGEITVFAQKSPWQ